MPKPKIYPIKITRAEADKLLELCHNEMTAVNKHFIEQMQILQGQIQQLYIDKMSKVAELSAIVNKLEFAIAIDNNGKTSSKSRKKTDDENTASE